MCGSEAKYSERKAEKAESADEETSVELSSVSDGDLAQYRCRIILAKDVLGVYDL